MRRLLVASMTVAALTLPSGCSDCAESVDCSPATEFEGASYSYLGSTELDGVPVGTGKQTGCEDICGFEAGEVEVYKLEGFSTTQVIGLRGSNGDLSVAVSLDLTEREQLRIRRQVNREE